MARGRMLNKSVSASRKFNELSDDTCRLLATWLIAHLDCRGVFYGDPAMVKSLVFPRRTDVSVDRVQAYLYEMVEAGLIRLFHSDGDIWQCWPGFADNQTGLRADRESSDFPPPPDDAGDMPATGRNNAGQLPAEWNGIHEQHEQHEGEGQLPPRPLDLPPAEELEPEPRPAEPLPIQETAKPPPTKHQIMFAALKHCCNIVRLSEDFRGWANRTAKELLDGGVVPGDVDRFSLWYKSDTWRAERKALTFKTFQENFDAWVCLGKPLKVSDNGRSAGGDHGLSQSHHRAAPADPGKDARAESRLERIRRRAADRAGPG